VRVAPKIDEHDLETKVKTAARLLEHGDKLKLVVRFRGRELAHPDRGRTLLMLMADRLKEQAVVERMPLLEGRQMVMVMNPLRAAQQAPVRPAVAPAPAPAPTPAAPAPRATAPPARPAPAPARTTAAPRPVPARPVARPAATRTQRPA
jgi:translation initiation factor IF-3